jgi:hypothetical protein
MNKSTIRFVIITVIGILALIGLYFTWQISTFRVTSTTPKNNEVTAGINSIDFNFSQSVGDVSGDNLSASAQILTGISKKDAKTVTVGVQNLVINKEYTITLKNIRSEKGDTISEYTYKFKVKNLDFSELSEAERKRQLDNTDKGNYDNPLAAFLPHETTQYKITYTEPVLESTELPDTITITMKFFEPGSNAAPATPAQKQTYLNDIRKYRTEALNYLKDKGVDINKYVMVYTEPDLRNEFPKGYVPVQENE